MGRRQVEPGGEAGKAGAVLLHVGDRLRRHQLGALATEQVGVGDHEIFDATLLGEGGKIDCHCVPLWIIQTLFRGKAATCLGRSGNGQIVLGQKPPLPGIQLVPASGTCAMAAASMVSAHEIFRLEIVHVVLAAGARDGLRFQRHHLEIVGKPASGRDRIEALRQAPGPAW